MPSSASVSLTRTVRQAKIVGGTFAERGEFPHQVSLLYNGEFSCGGSILSTLLILTAAHCVKYKRPNRLKVVAGEHDRSAIQHESGHLKLGKGSEQIRTTKYIYMHEEYVWETDVNDIAILVLTEPFQYTAQVQNISLPQHLQDFEGYAVATGWGRTKEKGAVSDILRKVKLPIVSNEECSRRYRNVHMKITHDMMCAGEAGRDACQGDSGGPAVCGSGKAKVICGIVSHGFGCGRTGYPGVLTKVANYIPWIENTMKKIISRAKCRTDYFYCDGKCIPRRGLCDLIPNCSEFEDENQCINLEPCRDDQFRCNNGRCISEEYTCDDFDDCGDNSEEDKCPNENKICIGNQHQCGPGGRCVPSTWINDSQIDCDDFSDADQIESNTITTNLLSSSAPNPCRADKFYCRKDYRCIPKHWVCDKDRDCRKGEDEENCPFSSSTTTTSTTTTTPPPTMSCSPHQFYCGPADDKCIPQRWRCDGQIDCEKSGIDEVHCGSIFMSSNLLNLNTSGSENQTCSRHHFQCIDGNCISNIFVCDGDSDCPDSSDETYCKNQPSSAVVRTCSPYFWQCDNGECIYHKFRCDREPDCTDKSDEKNCEDENDESVENLVRRRKPRRRSRKYRRG